MDRRTRFRPDRLTRGHRVLLAAELDLPTDLALGLDAPLLVELCAIWLDGDDAIRERGIRDGRRAEGR